MKLNTNETNNPLFYGDLKEQYLSNIKETTRVSYERIFKMTKPFELILGKDIKDFNKEEIEKVLLSFQSNNRNTIESYARIISAYMNWAVENGKAKTNILKYYKPEDFEKFLTNDEEYISEKQLRRYEDSCENFQDAVILRLLFIGVGGRQMSEIRNLKKSDIDVENMRIKLTESLKEEDGHPTRFTQRYMDIDERTLYLLNGAINQKMYTKRNGMMVETDNVRPYTDLADNDYVVRPSITKLSEFFSPVDKYVLYRRISTLAETLGIKLTSKFIQRSGMIYYANKLIVNEELSLNDIKVVANKFGVKSYHNLKGFLTVDNIRRIYKS